MTLGRTVSVKGRATLTAYGRQVMAAHALKKGESFIAAAILLRSSGHGHPQVVAHLYLQGLEVVLKCVLQIVDPAQYTTRRLKAFSHDLVALIKECSLHAALRWRVRGFVASPAFASLAARYKAAQLRYPDHLDWFRGDTTLPPRLLSFAFAVAKWARRAVAARGLVS